MKRTPLIIAVVLLLLPVLYIGSYLVLVEPQPSGPVVWQWEAPMSSGHYGRGGIWADRIFWPLEQIDRKVRPGAWEIEFEIRDFHSGAPVQ